MTSSDPSGPDLPGRVLAAAVRVLPADRRDWGAALRAELATVTARSDRWGYARAAVRVALTRNPALRAVLHAAAVLATLATVFAWAATVDYPPLLWGLDVVAAVLAAVCWQARRAALLGPVGNVGPSVGASVGTALLLRVGGYLTAAAIAAVAVAHLHPATSADADDGTGTLVFAVAGAAYVLGVATVAARRSAATRRVLVTGAGCGLAAAAAWLATTVLAPPIPPTTGWALTLCGLAAVAAAALNTGRSGPPERAGLAGLLATATAPALIFATVVALARYGPDRLIPAVTPHALPADRVSESRIEIVDPYVLFVVLGTLAATALGVAAVATRPRRRPQRWSLTGRRGRFAIALGSTVVLAAALAAGHVV